MKISKHLKCTVLALLFTMTAQTAWADDVAYLDANGAQQTCSTYTTVTNSSTSWSGGWYVVSSSTTLATTSPSPKMKPAPTSGGGNSEASAKGAERLQY